MKFPLAGQYINIHTHGSIPEDEVYSIENLMAHEERLPEDLHEHACSYGIHPWNLTSENHKFLLDKVIEAADKPNLVAIGESGFDKIKGPSAELQTKVFEQQVEISEKTGKPVIIHCVKAWDELLASHKRLKPEMPWLIHGFRGSKQLAVQFISRGFYISFWFDFIIKAESSSLIRSLPHDKLFFETDGAAIDIRGIYSKVSEDLDLSIDEMKAIVYKNYNNFFQSVL